MPKPKIGLMAEIAPSVDDQKVREEKRKLENEFESVAQDIEPDFKTPPGTQAGGRPYAKDKDLRRVDRMQRMNRERTPDDDLLSRLKDKIPSRDEAGGVARQAGGAAKEGLKFGAEVFTARTLRKLGVPVTVPSTNLPGLGDIFDRGGDGGGGGGGPVDPEPGAGGAMGTSASEPDRTVPILQAQLEVQEEILELLEDDFAFGDGDGGDGRRLPRMPGGKLLGMLGGGLAGLLGAYVFGSKLMNFLDEWSWPDLPEWEWPEIPEPDWLPIVIRPPDGEGEGYSPEPAPDPTPVPEPDGHVPRPDEWPSPGPTPGPGPTPIPPGRDLPPAPPAPPSPVPAPMPVPDPRGHVPRPDEWPSPGEPDPPPLWTPSPAPTDTNTPRPVDPTPGGKPPQPHPLLTETLIGAAGMGILGGAGIVGVGSGAASGSAGSATPTLGAGIPVGGLPFLNGAGNLISGLGGRGPFEQGMSRQMWQMTKNARTRSSSGVGPDTPEPSGDGKQAPGITVQRVFFDGGTMFVVFKGVQNPIPYSQLPSNIRRKVDSYLQRGGGGGGGGNESGSEGTGNGGNRAEERQRSETNVDLTVEQYLKLDPSEIEQIKRMVDRRVKEAIREFEDRIERRTDPGVTGGSLR
jgi:hypothetical protein